MRATIDINPDLLIRAKAFALAKGKNIDSIIEEGLFQHLKKTPHLKKRKPIKLIVSSETGGVLQGVNLSSNEEMLNLMESR